MAQISFSVRQENAFSVDMFAMENKIAPMEPTKNPLPYVMTIVGYFIIMIIDRLIPSKYHIHSVEDFEKLTKENNEGGNIGVTAGGAQ